MSQNTNSSTIEVALKAPANWDSWNHQFTLQAVAARLWNHIDLEEPLLKKPKLPLIGSYQRQARVQPAERAQTRGQTADQAQAPEPAQSGSQSQTLDDDDDDDQVLASDLTNQGRAALQLDIQYYTQQEKEFREQDSAVQTLKKWVANTVSPHYVEVACSATETLA